MKGSMPVLLTVLLGYLATSPTRLWCSTIQLLCATVSGVAAATETAVELGSVVVRTAESMVGVATTAGGGVTDTIGSLLNVMVTAANGVEGYVADLKTAALIAIGVLPVVTVEALGDTEKDWLLLDNAEATTKLQAWSDHNWKSSETEFSDDDVRIFLEAARVMAVASVLSYAESSTVETVLKSNVWNVNLIENQNSQAMLFKVKKEPIMILAFRDTQLPFDGGNTIAGNYLRKKLIRDWEFLPDWLLNFDAKLTPYELPNGPQVHEGFKRGWTLLRDRIQTQVSAYSKEHNGATIQMYVTGHSLGAALAAVALLQLLQSQKSQPYKVKGCLLLASPRHGDQAYTDAIQNAIAANNIPLDMLANQNGVGCDPVMSLPPTTPARFASFAAPAGRLWVVQVGKKTTGPLAEKAKLHFINAKLGRVLRRIALNIPLHLIGGRVGYLHAMEK